MRMRARDIDTNGISLHCEAVGYRADPAVLLIMGTMSSAVIATREQRQLKRTAWGTSAASLEP